MSDLLAEKDGAIATLCLNRPERMNAISGQMLQALAERLVEFDRDPEVLLDAVNRLERDRDGDLLECGQV